MSPIAVFRKKRLLKGLSLRNCVLLSVLAHVALFCFPFEHRRVEAMSGGMSMSIVASAGKVGHGSKQCEPPSAAVQKTLTRPATEQVRTKKKHKAKPVPGIKPLVRYKAVPVAQPEPVVSRKKKSVRPVNPAEVKSKPAPEVAKKQDVHVKEATKFPRKVMEEKALANTLGQETARHVAGKIGADDHELSADSGQDSKQGQPAGEGAFQGPMHARIGSLYGPKITHWIRPKYPRKARAMRQTGLVVLRITIDRGGRPVRVEIVQKAGFGFDEAAVSAIRKSSFTPATHKGQPVACIALLPVHFNLRGN